MKDYRYKLASNKVPKLNCPFCRSKKHWQRYIDTMTGEVLPEKYGLCDNRIKCGGGVNPYKDGFKTSNFEKRIVLPEKPPPVYIPSEVLRGTQKGYEQNNFIQYLLERAPYPYEVQDIEKVVALYQLGTIVEGYMRGAVTFPFIDIDGNIRAIQVKEFDESNHTKGTNKIDKLIFNGEASPQWLKDYIKYGEQEGYFTCCFGEHLLRRFEFNPVILVEAPKTAIYGTLTFGFPDNPETPIWLSVYNINGLSYSRCKSLKGREVFLIPDLSRDGSAFRLWEERSKALSKQLETKFEVLDHLEALGTPESQEEGLDFADYVIRSNWRKLRFSNFRKSAPEVDSEIVKSERSEQSEGPENISFSDQNEERIDRKERTILGYINSFWDCVRKYKPKDFEKSENFEKYLYCWSKDMEKLINDNGRTREEFVKLVLEDCKKQ